MCVFRRLHLKRGVYVWTNQPTYNSITQSFSAVRTGVDRLLGPLSLLRLVECALAAAQYTGRATAVVAVTVVEFARGGVAGIVRQVCESGGKRR